MWIESQNLPLFENAKTKLRAAYLCSDLKAYRDRLQTITSDNGKEFACHEEVASELNIGFYFAHPYHSWERGLNENTNGLIRQYFPKGADFREITESEIKQVEQKLNTSPRKPLSYYTPDKVLNENPKTV